MGVDGKRLAEPPLCYEVGVGGRAGGGLMAEYRKSVSACAAAGAMGGTGNRAVVSFLRVPSCLG